MRCTHDLNDNMWQVTLKCENKLASYWNLRFDFINYKYNEKIFMDSEWFWIITLNWWSVLIVRMSDMTDNKYTVYHTIIYHDITKIFSKYL